MAGVERSVLLYSGGMDSVLLRALRPFDVVLFVHVGTKDACREYERMRGGITVVNLPLQQFELPNKIIPFRNFMLAFVAANYGNQIYLGATAGDTTKDKDWTFAHLASACMNYFASDPSKMPIVASHWQIWLPFKYKCKSEIVQDAISSHGLDKVREMMIQSRSCYAGEKKECGVCRSCLRKFVACHVNGIFNLPFEVQPDAGLVRSHLLESKSKGRSPRELADIKQVIRHLK